MLRIPFLWEGTLILISSSILLPISIHMSQGQSVTDPSKAITGKRICGSMPHGIRNWRQRRIRIIVQLRRHDARRGSQAVLNRPRIWTQPACAIGRLGEHWLKRNSL
ncbi:hypothetical protein F4805DRAFT_259794 [Annulohypoxylon moriforme]|nr:hypothetical protein F4805DRAFT_259794 [Annulohypoxylon moriforme]